MRSGAGWGLGLSQHQLCYLDGVKRRPLLDLVPAHKQVQALVVVPGHVAADAAHKHIVLGGRVEGGGEPARGGGAEGGEQGSVQVQRKGGTAQCRGWGLW